MGKVTDTMPAKRSDLLQRKKELGLQLLELTRRQKQVLAEEGLEVAERIQQLEKLLQERQKCMDVMDEVNARLSAQCPLPGDSELEMLEIRKILQEVQQLDAGNRLQFEKLLAEQLGRMKNLQTSKQTFRTYNKRPRQVQGFFVDKKK